MSRRRQAGTRRAIDRRNGGFKSPRTWLDLLDMLGQWGKCRACTADLDDDGTVGILDVLALLGAWGEC